MKRTFKIAAALLVVLELVACSPSAPSTGGIPDTSQNGAGNQEKIVAMMGHVGAESSSYQYGCQKFADLVYERTNGGLQIDIYPNSQLGTDTELYESLQNNTIQLAGIGIDMLSNYIPELRTLELPFLFEDVNAAVKVYDSEVVLSYIDQTKEHHVVYLGMMNSGFRQLETTNVAVNSIDDIKGLKLRVPSGEMFSKIWNAVGTAPTPTNYNETYMALQTGVVEGVELPVDVFLTSGFPEICKNVAYINYRIQAPAIFVSEEFLNSLPEDYQTIVKEAAKEACADELKWFEEQEAVTRQKCEEDFGVSFTYPDLDQFRDACQPLYSDCEFPEFLEQVLAITGR